jgi:hypothetical protein
MRKRIRVRSKRLSQVDESKLSLALWLLAKELVVDKTTPADTGEATPPADQEQA